MPALADQIRSFIRENLLFGDDSRPLADADSLIENDIVDSTGILELVTFVEEQFGLVVEDHEILPENFDSIERVAAFVRARLAPAGAVAAE